MNASRSLLVSAFWFLIGCGNAPVMNQPMDSGPMPPIDSGNADRSMPDDRAMPIDNGRPPADVPPATVCVPMEGMLCAGQPTCMPNRWSPACADALSCVCDTSEAAMPAACQAAGMRETCMRIMTCSPGANHCSVDLPDGINWAPFAFDAELIGNADHNLSAIFENDGHGTPRSTSYDWVSENGIHEHFYQGATLPSTSATGFRLIYLGRPEALDGMTTLDPIPLTCADHICYWNRSSVMSHQPSLEVEFQSPCRFVLRIIGDNGTPLQPPTTFSAQRTDC